MDEIRVHWCPFAVRKILIVAVFKDLYGNRWDLLGLRSSPIESEIADSKRSLVTSPKRTRSHTSIPR